MDDQIDIRFLEYRDAGSFFGCEVCDGDQITEETAAFRDLKLQINEHFESEQHVVGRVTLPQKGNLYIGRHPEYREWHRVLVKDVLVSSRGSLAICFFVDSAETLNLPVHLLREAPEQFTKLRYQARLFVLSDVRPQTMTSDPDTMVTTYQPAVKWDISALKFVKKLLENHKRLQASITGLERPGNRVYIRLFVTRPNDSVVCVNDELVKNQYACKAEENEPALTQSVHEAPESFPPSASLSSQSSTAGVKGSPAKMRSDISAVHTDERKRSPALAYPRSSATPSPRSDTGSRDSPQPMGRGARMKHLLEGSPPPLQPITTTLPAGRGQKLLGESHRVLSPQPTAPLGRGQQILSSHGVTRSRSPQATNLGQQASKIRNEEWSDESVRTTVRVGRDAIESPTTHEFVTSPLSDHEDKDAVGGNAWEERKKRRSIQFSDTEEHFSPSRSGDCESPDNDDFVPRRRVDASGLLAQICGGLSDNNSLQVETTPDEERVFYSGPSKPRAVISFKQVSFGPVMADVLGGGPQSVLGPTKLQTFVWPPLQRAADVIGIAPGKQNGGKTLTYVVPLLYSIKVLSEDYSALPPGNGPLVVILCSSWQSARMVYEICRRVANSVQLAPHRVLLIYGAEADGTHEINIVNGCDVLVATPHCALRMLERNSLNFRRLCHLVLDDADVLCETFTKQVVTLMTRFREHKTDFRDKSTSQVLAFARTWSPALGVFARHHMHQPTLVIHALNEAAIFGKVKLVPVVCEPQQRVDKVLELCQGPLSYGGKTLIFTTSIRSSTVLAEHLQAADGYVLCAHEQMSMDELNTVSRQWRAPHDHKSPPILVATDEVLNCGLSVLDAKVVIHFDPPPYITTSGSGAQQKRQWLMGKRLWCMREYFANPVLQSKTQSNCVSYILLTPNICDREVKAIRKLLQRTYCPDVPPLLNTLADSAIERAERQLETSRPLCANLKAFGVCRNERRCQFRHLVFETDASQQNVPTEGVVKVLITCVRSGSHFYGRLLEHVTRPASGSGSMTPGSTTVTSLHAGYAKLFLQMSIDLAGGKACKLLDTGVPKLGELYAWEDLQHSFHRVKVVSMSEPGARGFSEKVEVFFLDTGETRIFSADQLLVLPDRLKATRPQAVELFACRVRPLDEDVAWTPEAERTMSDLIYDKELHGNIVLALGNCLWLDPLVERRKLSNVNTIENLYNVRSELLNKGHAQPNNQHLQLLYELCRDRIQLPDVVQQSANIKAYTSGGLPIIPEVCQLRMRANSDVTAEVANEEGRGEQWEDPEDWQEVYLSSIDAPNLIYLQLASTANIRSELLEDLRIHARYHGDESEKEATPATWLRPGTLVMALSPYGQDGLEEWQRAKIMGEVQTDEQADGKLDVTFVDTGEQEFVKRSDLLPLHFSFLRQPFQAIECSLVHVQPVEANGEWPEEVSNFMWEFTRENGESPKAILAKVHVTSEARTTGRLHYGVQLYVGSRRAGSGGEGAVAECGLDVTTVLVAKGMARLTSERIAELCPVKFTEEVEFSYRYLPVLCSVILEQPEVSAQHAKTIFRHVLDALKRDHCADLLERGLVTCLCHVFTHVWRHDITGPLCQALIVISKCLTKCPQPPEAIRAWVNQLCAVLELCTDLFVRRDIMFALKNFATSTDMGHNSVLERGGIRILCNLVRSSPHCYTAPMDSGDNLQANKKPKVLFPRQDALQTLKDLLCNRELDSSEIHYVSRSALLPVLCTFMLRNDASNHSNQEHGDTANLTENCSGACGGVKNLEERSHALECLQVLAKHSSVKDAVRKHGGIKALVNMLQSDTCSASLQEHSVECLKRLASNNRFNKDHMHDLHLPDALNRVLSEGRLSADSLSMCRDLHHRLQEVRQSNICTTRTADVTNTTTSVRIAPKQLIRNKPLSKTEIAELSQPLTKSPPEVKWTQDRWNLLLTVTVRGLEPFSAKNKKLVQLDSRHIGFSVVADAVQYTFNFTLYDLIVVGKCEMKLRPGTVLIGLRKKERGQWPRLLESKNKLSYLKVDHDKFLDSSSESEEDSEEQGGRPVDAIPRPLQLAKRCTQRQVPFSADGQGQAVTEGRPDSASDSNADTDSDQSNPDDWEDSVLDLGGDVW